MWVTVDLKAPDDGSWVALTRVDADGSILPLGYVNTSDYESAIANIPELYRGYKDALDG